MAHNRSCALAAVEVEEQARKEEQDRHRREILDQAEQAAAEYLDAFSTFYQQFQSENAGR